MQINCHILSCLALSDMGAWVGSGQFRKSWCAGECLTTSSLWKGGGSILVFAAFCSLNSFSQGGLKYIRTRKAINKTGSLLGKGRRNPKPQHAREIRGKYIRCILHSVVPRQTAGIGIAPCPCHKSGGADSRTGYSHRLKAGQTQLFSFLSTLLLS